MTAVSKQGIDELVETAILIAFKRFILNETSLELDFPSSFTTTERAFVHQKATQHGLVSRSIGRSSSRYVTVRKKKYKEVIQSPMIFYCSPNSRRVLHSLLHRWPVRQKEKQDVYFSSEKSMYNQVTDFRSDINKPSGRLPDGIPQVPTKRTASKFDIHRANLPIMHSRDEILQKIRRKKVLIIQGSAGVGKTTQVPQFILDECMQSKEACRIISSQPHRISAVSMAERVAVERGECVGQTIGYQIRLESRASPRTLLTFCTNGVLLRTLMSKGNLMKSITHIIIDEVNERDHYSDFVLVKLRQLLANESSKNFKLILLTSSENIHVYQQYFKDAAIVKISNNSQEVKELFLDDILNSTGFLDREVSHLRQEKQKILSQAAKLKEWLTKENGLISNDSLQDSSYKDDSLDHEVQNITMKNTGDRDLKDGNLSKFEKLIHNAWFNKHLSSLDEVYKMITCNKISADTRHSKSGVTALMVACWHGDMDSVDKLLQCGADPKLAAPNNMTCFDFAQKNNHKELCSFLNNLEKQASCETLEEKDIISLYNTKKPGKNVDFDLVIRILEDICGKPDQGTVLILLPTYDDIIQLRDFIKSHSRLSDNSSMWIFILLGVLQTSNDQKQAFQPAPAGTRKIVLADSIAESAVTVNDVSYVIDSGLTNVTSYEALSGCSVKSVEWISRENVRLRAGLAGRSGNQGTCYHLFTKELMSSRMSDQTSAQLTRRCLHDLCLQVRMVSTNQQQQWGDQTAANNERAILSYFMEAPVKPPVENITRAIGNLKEIEALDSLANVTELGKHLIDLPIEPRLGKMVLCGVVLKCLDPILTISCSLAHNHPFINPTQANIKQKAIDSRLKFSAGTFSDHMCLLRAFQAWQKARTDGWEQVFCEKNFMSQATMETIVAMRSQLLGQLRATGFVRARGGNDIRDLNTNSENWAVVKAAICASSFPNIIHLDRKSNRLFTSNEKNVWLDHTSVLSRCNTNMNKTHGTALECLPSDWIVYDEIWKSTNESSNISLARCCTSLSSACIALFAGSSFISEKSETIVGPEVSVDDHCSDSDTEDNSNSCKVHISDWIQLQMDPSLAHLLMQLRTKWYSLFYRRIHNASKSWQNEDEAVLSTIINILSSEDQLARLTQPSGIGQRPKLVNQDDGKKSSCFIPKTPTNSNKKKEESSKNFHNVQRNTVPKSLKFGSGDASMSKNIGIDSKYSSNTCDKNAKYCTMHFNSVNDHQSSYSNNLTQLITHDSNCCFVYTIKQLYDVQILKQTGKWTVSKELRNTFVEKLKHENVYIFFVLERSEVLQDIVKLESRQENSFQMRWLQQSRTANQPVKRLWHNGKNTKITEDIIILEKTVGDILVQLVEAPNKIAPIRNQNSLPEPIRNQNSSLQQQYLMQHHYMQSQYYKNN